MTKRFVTLALTMLVTAMAWADIVTVSTEILWTFPSTMSIPTGADGPQVFEYNGLYIHQKAKSDNSGYEGFSLNSGRSYTNGSFSDGTEWSSDRSLVSSSGRTIEFNSNDVDAISPTYTLSLQTTVAGTLYVIGGNGNTNAKKLNVSFKSAIDNKYNVVGFAEMAAKSNDNNWKYEPYEAKATLERAGVFYIAGEAAYNIYAIRFVPSVYAPTFSQEGNIITITAGVCNINGATVTTYYTTDGTDPATSETRASFTESSKEITISANTTIKAISISSTDISGAVASEEFTYTAPAKTSIAPQISISNWTYGTMASTPVVFGTVGDGTQTIEYKVRNADDNTYTSGVPTAIGQYTVRVSIEETDNYEAGSATADFEIERGIGSISYETANVEKTTGDAAFTNPLTKVGDGTVSYASSNTEAATINSESGEVTIVGAGETTITATVENGSNYDYAVTTATYSLTVTAASVTKYAITLGDHNHGSLSVSPETAAEGETVTVTADPDNGYQLSSITITKTEDNAPYLKITNGTMTFTMPAYAVTVKVTYGRRTYNITYDLNGGNLVGEATNPTTYDISTATFTLNNPTKDGHTFAGWTGTDLTEPTETVTITKGSTGDRSYTATWTENTPAVTTISDVTISGLTAPVKGGALTVLGSLSTETTGVTISGITWSPTAETAAASTVYTATVTLTADTGYQFASTVTANAIAEKAAQVTRTDDTHVSVSYTFDETAAADPVGHTLNVNVDNASHGSVAITVNESAANSGDAVAEGASVSVIATANSGYTFKNWGNTELTANPYNFTMGTSDVNLTAIFEEEATGTEYTLTTVVNPEGKGTITYKIENESDNTTDTSFDEGTHLVFSVSSIDSEYEFDKWQVNGEDASAESDGTLKVTMNTNKTVSVVLKAKGTPQTPTVPMILVAGQSNADGRIKPSIAPLPYSNYTYTQISYCNGVNKTTEGTFTTFDATCDAGDKRWGFDAALYGCLETALESNFYVVKQTKGSTAISTSYSSNYCWSADATWLSENTSANAEGKSLAKALVSNVKACVQTLQSEGKTADIKCLFWHQGESDRGYASSYKDNLTTLVAYIRSELATIDSKYANLPIIVGTISQNSNQYNATIDGVFRNSGISNFYYIDMATASMYTGDSQKVHFDATSATYLGKQMFNKMIDLELISGTKVDAGSLPEPVIDNSTTYDFKTWATENVGDKAKYARITLDKTETLKTIDEGTSIYKIEDLTGNSDNLFLQGRFALSDFTYGSSAQNDPICIRGENGLYIKNTTATLSILGLNPGDAITITGKQGSNDDKVCLRFKSTNAFKQGNSQTELVKENDQWDIVNSETYIVKSGTQLDLIFGNTISHSIWTVKIEPEKQTIQNEYTITTGTYDHGTVTADKAVALKDETVTLTVTPEEGYKLKTLKANDTEVTLTDGTYSFTMADANVTIAATFEEIPDEEVTVDLDESGSTATMTINNNEATLTGVTLSATATTITVSGTVNDGTNDIPVKSIADNAFSSITDKTAIKAIDLSATSVTGIAVNRESGIFSGFGKETIIYLPSGEGNTAVGQKNVVIGGTCSDFEMEDGESYSIPESKSFTATSAAFKRTFTANQKCTVCLPYPFTATGGTIYEFTGIVDNQVQMTAKTDGSTLSANTPYIFEPSSGSESISASSVTISMSDAPKTENTADKFNFVGTYESKVWSTAPSGIYGFAAEAGGGATAGQFVRVGIGASIAPFRAYLEYTGDEAGKPSTTRTISNLPEVLDIVWISASGGTTGINGLDHQAADDAPMYNLSGQRVDKSYKGIVIQNGKKMIKK